MKVWLNQDIIGYGRGEDTNTWHYPEKRIHAKSGNLLPVILNNKSHFICDSINYPGNHIVVFPSQITEIIHETVAGADDATIEQYYNVYEEPKSVIDSDNDLPYSTLQSDEESMD